MAGQSGKGEKRQGVLCCCSADTGAKLSEVAFNGEPVLDGLAAGGRFHISTHDGAVLCFGRKQGACSHAPCAGGRIVAGANYPAGWDVGLW